MPTFDANGVTIAYDDNNPLGAERTAVLIHGFSSNRIEGWRRTGWYAALERRHHRMIAIDLRGHGESQKFYDPADYTREKMAGDVVALLDHLGVARADVFGFSMGSRVAVEVALMAPDRVSNLILGGVGEKMIAPKSEDAPRYSMSDAMLAEDVDAIPDPMARAFRQFAEEQGEDLKAIAAVGKAPNTPLDLEGMSRLPMPVLVMAGDRDHLAGDPEGLARAFPDGHGVVLNGCDHFSAIPHASAKATYFDFIDGMLDDPFPNPFAR